MFEFEHVNGWEALAYTVAVGTVVAAGTLWAVRGWMTTATAALSEIRRREDAAAGWWEQRSEDYTQPDVEPADAEVSEGERGTVRLELWAVLILGAFWAALRSRLYGDDSDADWDGELAAIADTPTEYIGAHRAADDEWVGLDELLAGKREPVSA